ncbi:MAG: hypothetical protein O3A82_16945 [Verrucomicrobia bacterium]|nr:hypothetical protein [Verrucomicrobiota bacterium]
MTALWEASSSRDATHHPTLSLRGGAKPRRGNPAEPLGNALHHLGNPVIPHLVIARRNNVPTRQSGDRFGYSIASSQNPAQRPGLDCHALTGSQ